MGKVEGRPDSFHGHITAVTVAPDYRRMGLAAKLIAELERVCERWEMKFSIWKSTFSSQNTYFVDLFVRVSNTRAIEMYERLGYVVYRRIIDYYSGDGQTVKDEDAFGQQNQFSL